jgi:hypothetical protein
LNGRSETGTKSWEALEAVGVEFIEENGDGPGGAVAETPSEIALKPRMALVAAWLSNPATC